MSEIQAVQDAETEQTNYPTPVLVKPSFVEKLTLMEIRPGIKVTPFCDKICAALARAQCEIGSLQRNRTGYNYKYADLAAVLECIKEPMAKNGLNLMQFPEYNENSQMCPVTTVITHESGQMLVSSLVVPIIANKGGNDVQAYGSAITYARRYAIMSVMNLAAEDDDAQKGKEFGSFNRDNTQKTSTSKTQSVTQTNNAQNTSSSKPGIQRAQAITTETKDKCVDCGCFIGEKVAEFSMRRFNKPLCMDCQKKNTEAQAG